MDIFGLLTTVLVTVILGAAGLGVSGYFTLQRPSAYA